jgi:hypothetical protein
MTLLNTKIDCIPEYCIFQLASAFLAKSEGSQGASSEEVFTEKNKIRI